MNCNIPIFLLWFVALTPTFAYVWHGYQNFTNNKVPFQSIWNKLALEELHDEINRLNRLEKILISKRILFKKITIMP